MKPPEKWKPPEKPAELTITEAARALGMSTAKFVDWIYRKTPEEELAKRGLRRRVQLLLAPKPIEKPALRYRVEKKILPGVYMSPSALAGVLEKMRAGEGLRFKFRPEVPPGCPTEEQVAFVWKRPNIYWMEFIYGTIPKRIPTRWLVPPKAIPLLAKPGRMKEWEIEWKTVWEAPKTITRRDALTMAREITTLLPIEVEKLAPI